MSWRRGSRWPSRSTTDSSRSSSISAIGPIADIRTADIEDFIADLKKPRSRQSAEGTRTLTPASINRTFELLRHMMNWAVGREYLDRTPFRRGTETLIRKLPRRQPASPAAIRGRGATLLEVAAPFLRSMIIAALDTGMRQGEMLALRFGDIDWKRQLIVLRGETTKSRKTRAVPIATARLRAVLEWLRLDADGEKKPDDALVFSDEAGEPVGRFRTAWVTAVLKAHGIKPEWKAYGWTALTPECQRAVPAHQPALARPAARVRITPGREGRPAGAGARPARPRVDHDDRALRQPEAREPAGRGGASSRAARASIRRPHEIASPDKLSSFCQEFGRRASLGCSESRSETRT